MASSEVGVRAAAISLLLEVSGRIRLGTVTLSVDAVPASGRSRARRVLVTILGFRASECAQKAHHSIHRGTVSLRRRRPEEDQRRSACSGDVMLLARVERFASALR